LSLPGQHRFIIAAAAIALPALPGSRLAGRVSISAQAPAVAARPQSTARDRRIVLEGAPNFRDLGGYATADGRHVRWGMIYRSGALSRLTPADYDRLSRLGIAVVCDFRRDSERTAAPTAWKGANPPVVLNLPGTQANRASDDTAADTATIATATAPSSGLSTLLLTSYPTYPTTLGGSYRTVLQQLMTQTGALLYHCTAGKDRTGTFSAMLLTMLGVPRQVVMDDYLLSNQYVVSQARIDAVVARGGTRESAIATIGVDRAYLDLMFKTIDTEYGSFDDYRRKVLGISDSDLTSLKAKLLE